MTQEIDDDLLYVVSSLRRIDIIHILSLAHFARNYEIADILSMKPPAVSTIMKDLYERGLVDFKKNSRYNFYFLTEKGEIVAHQLGKYHGFKQ